MFNKGTTKEGNSVSILFQSDHPQFIGYVTLAATHGMIN